MIDLNYKKNTKINSKTFAFFDFDGTITYCDTFFLFLLFSGRMRFIKSLHKTLQQVVLYKLHKINGEKAKENILKLIFSNMKQKQFEYRCRWYSNNILKYMIRNSAIKKINWHKKEGHILTIVSASLCEYILPWAKKNGFEFVLATSLEIKDLKITGKLSTRNCNYKEKVNRIKKQFSDLKKYTVYCYGNSKGDSAMLSLADFPYYKIF